MKLNSYKELLIWQKAIMLTTEIYKITERFPKSELYGLTSQMRRAAVPIPANIAEGWGRQYQQEYIQFLRTARGSATELETQIIISENLKLLPGKDFEILMNKATEVIKMLNATLTALYQKSY